MAPRMSKGVAQRWYYRRQDLCIVRPCGLRPRQFRPESGLPEDLTIHPKSLRRRLSHLTNMAKPFRVDKFLLDGLIQQISETSLVLAFTWGAHSQGHFHRRETEELHECVQVVGEPSVQTDALNSREIAPQFFGNYWSSTLWRQSQCGAPPGSEASTSQFGRTSNYARPADAYPRKVLTFPQNNLFLNRSARAPALGCFCQGWFFGPVLWASVPNSNLCLVPIFSRFPRPRPLALSRHAPSRSLTSSAPRTHHLRGGLKYAAPTALFRRSSWTLSAALFWSAMRPHNRWGRIANFSQDLIKPRS